MSREDAIKELTELLPEEFLSEYTDAIKMGIEALEQEPCEDCISRQAAINAAIEAADEWDGGGNRNREKIIEKALEQLPSVTAQPKIGYWEWLQYDGNPKIGNWHCSECRTIVPRIPEVDNTPIYKWCPMCGAKMSEIPTGSEGSDKE